MAGGPSYTKVQPVVEGGWGGRDPTGDAEQRKHLREAWAAWDQAVKDAPAARELLRRVDEQLPLVEANLAAADQKLEQARAAYVLREVIGPGGEVLADPEGRPMTMTHEDEEARDPGIVLAQAERTRWVQARGRLWGWADAARAAIAHAESQKPPGERPRD